MGTGGKFNQNIAVGGTPPFDGTWHNVFYTLDNGSYWEYVDGLPSTAGTYKHGDGLYNTRPLYIFGRNGAGNYVGQLDDIAVWSDAKGPSWAATVGAMADWYAISLDDPGIEEVASLDVLGEMAAVDGTNWWKYTNDFPGAKDGTTLVPGLHYTGVDDVRYVIFQSDGQGGWLGVAKVPEPASLVLFGLGALGLAWVCRRYRGGRA
jgi:hypothetical protein